MKYSVHFKKNLSLAYPVMLSHLGHMMVNVADSVMVGQLGAPPLAGASLANVIFHLLLMFGIGVSYAITPLVAVADGEGDIQRSSGYLKHAIVINFGAGVVLFFLIVIISPLITLLHQPPEVVDLAIPYLNIITMSLIPLMVFQTFRQFAEGISDTKMAMYIVILSNLINIGLNYIMIFGHLGVPAMGLNGAGYASLIARIIMALMIAGYIYYGKKYLPFRAGFVLKDFSKKIYKRLLNLGLPAGFQFLFEVGAFGFAAIMMGWLGTAQLAAHQIAISLAAISYMMASGLSAAATVRIGNQLGLKDIVTLRKAGLTLYLMVVVFMSVFAVVFIVERYFLPSLYISDAEVIQNSALLLVIAGFFQISDGIQVVSLGALRGLTDVKIPTLITFVTYWLVALPTAYCLAFIFDLGAQGIWYGLLTGLTIAAILLSLRFNYLSKKLLTT